MQNGLPMPTVMFSRVPGLSSALVLNCTDVLKDRQPHLRGEYRSSLVRHQPDAHVQTIARCDQFLLSRVFPSDLHHH